MDLDALFILLQPWLRPFLAFVFFTFLRYFYRAVLLRVLHRFNSKTSFEYGEDLLNAFEKPVHFFLFIFAIYAALNCSPLTFMTILLSISFCAAFSSSVSSGAFTTSATLRMVSQ